MHFQAPALIEQWLCIEMGDAYLHFFFFLSLFTLFSLCFSLSNTHNDAFSDHFQVTLKAKDKNQGDATVFFSPLVTTLLHLSTFLCLYLTSALQL